MDFTLGPDRQMLADTLGRFLSDRYDFAARQRIADSKTGFSRETWTDLAELGIAGALFSEAAGGFGGGGFDISVVFEALGRALVVEPFLGAAMAAPLLAERAEVAEQVIAGASLVAPALYEPQARYDAADVTTRAARTADGWVLSGAKAVVPQIEAADLLLISARTDEAAGLSLFLVAHDAPGVTIRGYPLIDGGRGG